MRQLAFVVCLIATHAVAQTIALVGVSSDSKAIAVRSEDYSPEEPTYRVVVRDLESGEEKSAVHVGEYDDALDAYVPALNRLRPGARWVVPTCGQIAPTTKARITVKVVAATAGAWTKDGWWYADSGAAWKISVTRDGVEHSILQVPTGDELIPCWTPDGKRMVILVQTKSIGMRDPGRSELFIGSDGAPLIGIVGPTIATAQAASRQLSKKGYVVSSVSKSRKKRENTTIYFAAGQEPLGKQLAEVFPGSTVVLMDWASLFPAVVALGSK